MFYTQESFKRLMVLTLVFVSVLLVVLSVSTVRVGDSIQENTSSYIESSIEEGTQPTETTKHEPVYTYTEEELNLLARLIFAEGGSESFITQACIGSVVLNRLDSEHFPNTLREVIYQDSQFSVTTLKAKDGTILIDIPSDEQCLAIAKSLLDNGSILPKSVQVFYLQGKVNDPWLLSRKIYRVMGDTVFAHIYSEEEQYSE